MTAQESLCRAVAAEFQRLDAHQFGYDHGFCADPDADPETAAFVDAAIRVVAAGIARRIRDDATLAIDGLDDECCRSYGLGLARWMEERFAASHLACPSPEPPAPCCDMPSAAPCEQDDCPGTRKETH